jgi:thiol reductant ABC exporter CydC subunit
MTRLTNGQLRRKLLEIARPVIAPLALSTLFRAISLACGIAMLGIAGWGVGKIGWSRTVITTLLWPQTYISLIVAILVGLALVKGLTRYLEQFCGHLVAFKALARIRVFFYDRLEPQSPAGVLGRPSGDLLSRVTKDVDRIEVFFAHTLAPVITAVIVPVATVISFGFLVSPIGALVLAVGLGLVGLVTPRLGAVSSARAATSIRLGRGAVAQQVTDSVQGVREVLAFDYGNRRLDELATAEQPIGTGLNGLGNWIAARRGLNVLIAAATLIAELAVLSQGSGQDFLPTLGLGLGLTIAAFAPVLAVEDFAADLQQAYASARRVFEITDAVPTIDSPAKEQKVSAAPVVQFENVTFNYPAAEDSKRSEAAVDGVTFTAESGQTTALVGVSGSGKSTLASLLTRTWDPDSGQITIDGIPLNQFPLEQLRSVVGLANQRPYLFNDTIRANLLLAVPDAVPDDIAAAIRAADFDSVVAGEPEGLDAPVGEMGERLSGGQQQRLALARLLLRNPSVLVLDEVTSQLDAASEAQVLARVSAAADGRTIIMIAHRLTTLRDVDRIVVMDAGRVVEQGTFDELSSTDGPFAQLLAREVAMTNSR